MSVRIAVGGSSRVQADLRALAATVPEALADALTDELDAIALDERRLVPVDTGELRRGIAVRRRSPHRGEVGIFDPDLWWAVFVEWGRRNAAPRPFVIPARELARRRWPARTRAAAARALKV